MGFTRRKATSSKLMIPAGTKEEAELSFHHAIAEKIEKHSILENNGTQTHKHLVRKRTLNHSAKLAKWLSYVVSTYLYGVLDCMLLSCHVLVSE